MIPRTRRFACCWVAPSLAAIGLFACPIPTGTGVADGQPCEPADECESGSSCFDGICRQVCNGHRYCAKAEACESGVCLPVADFECDEDADCTEPSACESILDAICYAGECHYHALAQGLPCEDENACTSNDQCDSAGTCSGEATVCDDPPDDSCLLDGSVFRDYVSSGVCNPTNGWCEYAFQDRGCTDCEHQCLGRLYAPADLVATPGNRQVTLTWAPMSGAVSYNVYVSQIAGEAANAVPTPAAAPPYQQADLSNGTTYYFAVSAVGAGDDEGDLTLEVSATPWISAPAAVVARGDLGEVTLTWEPVTGAQSYNVYWSLQPGVTVASNWQGGASSPFVHGQLATHTTYYYAVSATEGPNESALSGEVSATTALDIGAKLMAFDAQDEDRFGCSVALSGDYAIVGARLDNGGEFDEYVSAGAAYLFHRTSPGTWEAGTKLVAPVVQTYALFGHRVALSGDYAVVGAPGPLTGAGAAHVFRRTDVDTWGAGVTLEANDAQAGDYLGQSVAIDGNYVVVGAFFEDGGDGDPRTSAGAAYVFHRTGLNTWDAGVKLVAGDAQADDVFGNSVSISGDYIVVGAFFEDGGDGDPRPDAGAAYVFHRTGVNTWDAGTKLVAPDPQANDSFGSSVAVAGDYVIVGANHENGGDGDPLFDAGAAYVFHRTGTNSWDAGTKLIAPDPQRGHAFGGSVALSGDHAIVGVQNGAGGAGGVIPGAGVAYLFHRTGENSWDAGTKLLAPDAQESDAFGASVALSGSDAIAGSLYEDGGDNDPIPDTGAAYVFEL